MSPQIINQSGGVPPTQLMIIGALVRSAGLLAAGEHVSHTRWITAVTYDRVFLAWLSPSHPGAGSGSTFPSDKPMA